jgi:hypothetical protein
MSCKDLLILLNELGYLVISIDATMMNKESQAVIFARHQSMVLPTSEPFV